jgi:tRNA(adenine34) deaminase
MTLLQPPDDEYFMRQALREAQGAYAEGEVPIGCVIVKEGKILGHAEILAMGAASGALENWRLDGCTLYATLEPCPMCAGAILNGRVAKVVYGSKDKRLGALGSAYDILTGNPLNRSVEVVGGILADECLELLRSFFKEMRKRPAKAEPGED